MSEKLNINTIKKVKEIVKKNISSVLAKSQTVGDTAKVAKPASKTANVAGKVLSALGPVVDIAVGTMDVIASANVNNTAGQKAYDITGDIVGIAANLAMDFVAGPLVLVVIFIQICSALLDSVWDPFKGYFNADLETIRKSIKQSLKDAFAGNLGVNYPIETKPDLLSNLGDTSSQDFKDFLAYQKKYLDDRGFITKEDVIAEEEYVLNLKRLKRQRKLMRYDENGNLQMMDPNLAAIPLLDSSVNNDLIMMAIAAKYALDKKQEAKQPSITTPSLTTPPINKDYNILYVIISFIALIIIFFSSIFIVII